MPQIAQLTNASGFMWLRTTLYKELLSTYPFDWDLWEREINLYIQLLREWNPIASLISDTDLAQNCLSHIEDSLSLIPYVYEHREKHPELYWLDIGSGGGFPVVPIALLTKTMKIILTERKQRKVGFLQLLIYKFKFSQTKVYQISFPKQFESIHINPNQIGFITARAVENPVLIGKAIRSYMTTDTLFLCQSSKMLPLFQTPDFIQQPIHDTFETHSLRRSTLTLIRKM